MGRRYLIGTFTPTSPRTRNGTNQTNTCKFSSISKRFKIIFLLALFHRFFIRGADSPGQYLTMDLNQETTYTGTDGLNYAVPKAVIQRFDSKKFDPYGSWKVGPGV